MKRFSNIIIYVLVGLFSFIFFLYLSFPYNILKETISSEISSVLGVSVSIQDLSPRFPLGLSAEGVKLEIRNSKEIELKKMSVSLSPLFLFLAKIKVNLGLMDSTGGSADLDLGFSLFDLIGGNPLPNSFSMETDKFVFGNLIELGLKVQANSPTMNPFIKPLLDKIQVMGKLTSSIDFSINTSDFSQSSGQINISLVDATIDFDPAMEIPSQKFESAIIKASSKGGALSFDPSSRFKTRDLDIVLTGKVIEKSKIEQSILDMEIQIELFKELKNTFGVIINAIAGREVEGKMKIKISGPVIPGPEIKMI